LDARLKTLLCKRIIVAEFGKVITGYVAESSKEGYSSKSGFARNDDDTCEYRLFVGFS
jgi:hypothetical protein